MTLEGMKAPAKLRAYTRDRGLTYEVIGGVVGVSGQTVTQWGCGASRPRLKMMFILQKLTGVMVKDWLTREERVGVESAAEGIEALRLAEQKEFPLEDRVSGRI